MQIDHWPVSKLRPYERNARVIGRAAIAKVAASLETYGWRQPIVVDAEGVIVAGHARHLAAVSLGWPTVPVHVARDLTPAQVKAYRLMDNKAHEAAGWDNDLLAAELAELATLDLDLTLTGFDPGDLDRLLDGLDAPKPKRKRKAKAAAAAAAAGAGDAAPKGSLVDAWGVPPLSVLDARQGYWQDRKRAWLATGLDAAGGRGAGVGETFATAGGAGGKGALKRGDAAAAEVSTNVSLFDPVLAEIAYRWFCPAGGLVLDPFAGGVVRGAVAAATGRRYIGVDLRAAQVADNRAQAAGLCAGAPHAPVWVEGDARNLRQLTKAAPADFVFTCPPYGDLERYSADPRDLSTMVYDAFMVAYRQIIRDAVRQLAQDRFAAIVVGDFRDAHGLYRSFVADTVGAFVMAGCDLYNEAVLVTPIGTAALRAGRQFAASRKLAKTHQNLLVFVKGDPKAATEAVGAVDAVADLGAGAGGDA